MSDFRMSALENDIVVCDGVLLESGIGMTSGHEGECMPRLFRQLS